MLFFFFFKQKTAYVMRISDWSSDVFSSDLKIDFSGGSVRVDYDRTLRKSDASGQFDSLKWADGAGGQGTITNFTVEGHNTVAAQGDVQVHNVVRVERITAQHPGSPDRKSTRLNSSH